MEIVKQIESLGIVPVVKLNRPEQAVPLCRALIRGGLPVAEITFRTEAAVESIRQVSQALPDMLVGAGTVLSVDQARSALEAGARFIVTPGFNPEVVGWCVAHKVAVFPGCPTTSDIERALALGLKVVKFFPAEAMGGLAVIRAVSAPYPQVRFMPTGGIHAGNLNEYLHSDRVVACGGSWMAPESLIEAGDFERIEQLTREAVARMLGFELMHVGVNCENREQALATARQFSLLFGWPLRETEISVFSGPFVEAMVPPCRGAAGHIAVGTCSVTRAQAHLSRLGFEFDEASAREVNGKRTLIYLKQPIGGFAVHLIQK